MWLRWVLLLFAVQLAGVARGTNSCVDPLDRNYRCGSTRIFLTRCGLANADLPAVGKCLDATAGGRNNITQLFFSGNDVTYFPYAFFRGTGSLQVLAIDDNRRLNTLPEDAFAGLRSLEMVSITRNGLTHLHAGAFSDQQRSLLALYITDNRQLQTIPHTVFAGLGSLKRLVVSFSGQGVPHGGMFSDLTNLDQLTILRDVLADLPHSPFSELETLIALKMALPGDEMDAMHCVPATGPALVGGILPGQSAQMVSWSDGKCGDFHALGKGILFGVVGEPKSGTTLVAATTAALATHLCGNPSNQWWVQKGLALPPDHHFKECGCFEAGGN